MYADPFMLCVENIKHGIIQNFPKLKDNFFVIG